MASTSAAAVSVSTSTAIPSAYHVNQSAPATPLVFQQIRAGNLKGMQDLRVIFERVLVPLYGSQEKALKQFELSVDRVCFLLYEETTPVGVIAFKTTTSDEFEKEGIKNSFEIKSLFVVESTKNSGRGIGSILLNKVLEETSKLQHDSLHVTVSAKKAESIYFFVKNGFRVMASWPGRYEKGTVEHLLSRLNKSISSQKVNAATVTNGEHRTSPNRSISMLSTSAASFAPAAGATARSATGGVQAATAAAAAAAGANSAAQGALSSTSSPTVELHQKQRGQESQKQWSPRLVKVINNAHFDNIHGLKLLSDGTFVSGSKDNTLRKWSRNGDIVREVLDVDPGDASERNWITALAVVNDDYWISGNRSGTVTLWNTKGDFVRNLSLKLPARGHVCYEQNVHRINSLTAGFRKQSPSFFVGFPTMFSEYSLIEGRTISVTPVHSNDWVYAVHPLTATRNLVVTAGTLEVWEKTRDYWNSSSIVYAEKRASHGGNRALRGHGRGRGGRGAANRTSEVKQKRERHHISALTPLEASPNHFALGIFGGYTAVVDIARASTVAEWKEHVGNVWAVENVTRGIFASSGEDGFIKLWDARLRSSVSSLGKHIGAVTSLLRLDDNTLIAGACADDPASSQEGAQLLFFDIRR